MSTAMKMIFSARSCEQSLQSSFYTGTVGLKLEGTIPRAFSPRKFILFSPISTKSKFKSGISIRIEGVSSYLKSQGIQTVIVDKIRTPRKADYTYLLVSTKKDSISYSAARNIEDKSKVIVDLYTPLILEKELTFSKYKPFDWVKKNSQKDNIKLILSKGSHFFVANKRQKEYWLTFSEQESLNLTNRQISVIPTGYSQKSIKPSPQKKILWFGGIYPWMNPYPLIEAFKKITDSDQEWKLKILGGFHPETGYQKIYKDVTSKLKTIPKNRLEILPWLPAKDLNKNLADVSFCVNLVKESKEDFYSHRVRLLTVLNAGIPILTNGKDTISDLAVEKLAGEKVHARVNELYEKMSSLINNKRLVKKMRDNALKVQNDFIKENLSDKNFKSFVKKSA
ncbi:MAG: hypothetical protein NUV69_04075 [Candidatus Curtissbacteria bacterium]|nr:hypothetical protein [Candidatus Curtissbacteria bacterium]